MRTFLPSMLVGIEPTHIKRHMVGAPWIKNPIITWVSNSNLKKCHSFLYSKDLLFPLNFDLDRPLLPLFFFHVLPLATKPSFESSSLLSDTLFLNSLEFKAALTSSIKRVSLLYIMVSTKCSQEFDREHIKIMALSSSSILTSIFLKSMIVLLYSSRWSLMDIPSFLWRVYNHFFKYKWFVRDFVMYKLSNFNHNLAIVSSSTISQSTSSPKHNRIGLCVLSISSSFSLSNIVVGRALLPFSALDNPYWTNKAHILTCHKHKLFLPSNFSTSNFVAILGLITLALIPICCANHDKE